MNCFKSVLLVFIIWTLPLFSYSEDFLITAFGAKGDGWTTNTKFIQKAIDDCSLRGGNVIIPSGVFLTGTLYLKSNVTLYLEHGAKLLGSLDSVEYPVNSPVTVRCWSTHSKNGKPKSNLALIYAENQQNIGIEGKGTIDGNGNAPKYQRGDNGGGRPKNIFFISCRNVSIKDVLLTNSPFWMQDYLGCDGLTIDGVRVINHANWNNDGLDIDSRNVRVSNCFIDSDDDGICLKSYLVDRPCENITITNCVVNTNCNAVKLGTPGYGGFKNITISNITIQPSAIDNFRHWKTRDKYITSDASMVTGLSIECVDGGISEGLIFTNLSMRGTQTPIFVWLGNRQDRMDEDHRTAPGSLKNVIISNIVAEQHSRRSSSITAFKGTYVENIKLSHIIIDTYSDATSKEGDIEIPKREKEYPSPRSLGSSLPSLGFFLRHVKNASISDVQFNNNRNDGRPVLVLDNVHHSSFEDIELNNTGVIDRFIQKSDLRIKESTAIILNGKLIKKASNK